MTESRVRGFRFPGPERGAGVMGLSLPQLGVVGFGVVAAVAIVTAMPGGMGLAVASITSVAVGSAAVVPIRRRRLDEWAPILARWFVARARGTHRWRSSSAVRSSRGTAGVGAVPPPPLSGVTLLRVRQRGAEVAVVRDTAAATYTAVVACRGRAFALLDGSEQERLVALWGDVLAAFASEGSPTARLAWVERTVPQEGDALAAYLDAASQLDRADPIRASYEELVAAAGPVTRHHESYFALSIDAQRSRRAVRQAGGDDGGACQVVLREMQTAVERLQQAEIDVVEILGPRRLAAAIRAAYDPGSVPFLAARARGTSGSDPGIEPTPWPMATDAAWSHYRTDSGFHATYALAGWPRREVPATFLHPLILRPEHSHAMTVVMEPIPPSQASRAAESAHATYLADEELRSKAGYLPTARRQKEQQAILARERELADGHGEYRYAGYVTVTARSIEELEEATGEIERFGYDAQVELRRLYGEQDQAFTYTLPLARGL